MTTPLKDSSSIMDVEGIEEEQTVEERFLFCTGEFTEEERNYCLKTGQMHEINGEYFDISTLSESEITKDLDMTQPVPLTTSNPITEFSTPNGNPATPRKSKAFSEPKKAPILQRNRSVSLDFQNFDNSKSEQQQSFNLMTVESSDDFSKNNLGATESEITKDMTLPEPSTTSIPLVEYSTPNGNAATPRKSKTFSGLKKVPILQRNPSVSLDFQNFDDSNISELPLPQELQQSFNLMTVESSDDFSKNNLGATESEITKDLTLPELSTTSIPLVEYSTPNGNAAAPRKSKTFSGLKKVPILQRNPSVALDFQNFDDSNISELPQEQQQSFDLMTLESSNDFSKKNLRATESEITKDMTQPEPSTTSIPLVEYSTPNGNAATPRKSKTFSGPKKVPILQRNPNVSLDFQNFDDSNISELPQEQQQSFSLMTVESSDDFSKNNLGTTESEITKDMTLPEPSTTSIPLVEYSTPNGNAATPRKSKTFSGLKKVPILQRNPSVSLDFQNFDDSNISELPQEQQQSFDLMTLESSDDFSKNNLEANEGLDDTFDIVTALLARADAEELEAEAARSVVKETPIKLTPSQLVATPSPSPSPLKNKRLLQLKRKNYFFSPSPPRPMPNSATAQIFKTPTSRPKNTTPKKVDSSPSRKLYANVQAKVDSGLRKSLQGYSLGLDSPVADYIHTQAAPSPFQRVTGIPNKIMSAYKSNTSKPIAATMIPRPSLPSLGGSSKYNAQLLSSGFQTEAKFKLHQYTGPTATVLNNASFAEKHQKENYLAAKHIGVRDENVDVSIVEGLVIPKKFIQSKLATPRSYVK